MRHLLLLIFAFSIISSTVNSASLRNLRQSGVTAPVASEAEVKDDLEDTENEQPDETKTQNEQENKERFLPAPKEPAADAGNNGLEVDEKDENEVRKDGNEVQKGGLEVEAKTTTVPAGNAGGLALEEKMLVDRNKLEEKKKGIDEASKTLPPAVPAAPVPVKEEDTKTDEQDKAKPTEKQVEDNVNPGDKQEDKTDPYIAEIRKDDVDKKLTSDEERKDSENQVKPPEEEAKTPVPLPPVPQTPKTPTAPDVPAKPEEAKTDVPPTATPTPTKSTTAARTATGVPKVTKTPKGEPPAPKTEQPKNEESVQPVAPVDNDNVIDPKSNDAKGYLNKNFAPQAENSHFLAYLITVSVLVAVAYLLFHNKQKILGLIVEGRGPAGSRGSRRYRKLDQRMDAEDSVPLRSEKTGVIY